MRKSTRQSILLRKRGPPGSLMHKPTHLTRTSASASVIITGSDRSLLVEEVPANECTLGSIVTTLRFFSSSFFLFVAFEFPWAVVGVTASIRTCLLGFSSTMFAFWSLPLSKSSHEEAILAVSTQQQQSQVKANGWPQSPPPKEHNRREVAKISEALFLIPNSGLGTSMNGTKHLNTYLLHLFVSPHLS